MKSAIITGASCGLGEEYLKQVIQQMPEIEEIWLIARRQEKLEMLASRFPDRCIRCLPLDLTDAESFDIYQKELETAQPDIVLLINNAGCGKLGLLADAAFAEQAGMVDLNCRALTAITVLSLPYMQRGAGILNVSSIASYAPTPRMTVYCATKSYVSAFSKSLHEELRPRGITVLTACPGPMATGFLEAANIIGRSRTFETLPYCHPERVARKSLSRLRRGKTWYTDRGFYKLYRVLGKLLPHSLVMKFSKT
ncbi:MAG: SDR family NAD(P)-dependent oxidoreductase [Clostridia bacterium]|nr:SDR family NAD(P)-dependent oxidoreductase [Clostridia bacterium]